MSWFANLFKKADTPTINSIQLDTSGWKLQEQSKKTIMWMSEDQVVISPTIIKYFFGLPPMTDLAGIRDFCRQLPEGGGKVGGIVFADLIQLQGVPAIKTIYKYEIPPSYGYTGLLIFPFKKVHYIISLASGERGITGLRDAFVTDQLLSEGKIAIEEFEKPAPDGSDGRLIGWFQDPYDPAYKGNILCSAADDEKYDSQFPDHPLTKIRKHVQHIENTMRFETSSPSTPTDNSVASL
jgi:hypothetical protein